MFNYCFSLVKYKKNKTILYSQILLHLKNNKKKLNIFYYFAYKTNITSFVKKFIYIYQIYPQFSFYPKVKMLLLIIENNFFFYILTKKILLQLQQKSKHNFFYTIKNYILFVSKFNLISFQIYQLLYFNLYYFKFFEQNKLIIKYLIYFVQKKAIIQKSKFKTKNKKKHIQTYLQTKQILNTQNLPQIHPKWYRLSPLGIIKKYKNIYLTCQKNKNFFFFKKLLKQLLKKSCLFTITKKNKKSLKQNYKYYKKQFYFFL